jgi:His/Glu/Gln/Arg/opine family amino acid ABC transporter permease subunit
MPDVIVRNLPFLLDGLLITTELAALTAVGGTLLGLMIGITRHLHIPVLSRLCGVYVAFIQGTPLLVVLFICYFAIPALLGYQTTAYRAALLGFILFIAGYLAEDFRAGLNSVRPSLVDAGLATGLTPWQVMRLIVLPQAIRRVIPALFNQYVRLFKFTSVASVIGVTEFTGGAMLINGREFAPVTILLTVALTYLVLCYCISLTGRVLFRHLAIKA